MTAIEVECRSCGAAAGKPCVTKRNNVARAPHVFRVAMWNVARTSRRGLAR